VIRHAWASCDVRNYYPARCVSCGCIVRVLSRAKKRGVGETCVEQFSRDGDTWSETRPPCEPRRLAL